MDEMTKTIFNDNNINVPFFQCDKCNNVPIIHFSCYSPIYIIFICEYCSKKIFYDINDLFFLIKQQNSNDFIHFNNSNNDNVININNNKCLLHSAYYKEFYCVNCKTIFCLLCKYKHLHHNILSLYFPSLEIDKLIDVNRFLEIGQKEINKLEKVKKKLNIKDQEMEKKIDSNINSNKYIFSFVKILIHNYNCIKTKPNYQVISNLLFFLRSLNVHFTNSKKSLNYLTSFQMINLSHMISSSIRCTKIIHMKDSVKWLLLLQDKKSIMIGSLSKDIEIYNVCTDNLEMTIEGHSLGVTYASLFDDKNGVITSSNDNTMKIWNIYAHSYQLIGTINCGCLILQILIFPHNMIISCSSSEGIIARTSFSPYEIIETEITNPPSFEVIKKIRNKYLFALSMKYSNCSLWWLSSIT